jgi:hypothetical protein
MKKLLILITLAIPVFVRAQSLVGTWQLTENKTCFTSPFKESDTEKELAPSMGGSSGDAVAKLIKFGEKGKGEEGIFSQGKKKGSSMNDFRYQVKGNELQFLDKKSGMITSRFVIDELTDNTLRFHNAQRDCESKTFIKVK